MARAHVAALAVALGLSWLPALHAAPAERARAAQRTEAIRHASVWTATDIRSKNLKAGPQGPAAFPPGQTVTCAFAPKKHGSGSTLKFDCALPSGRALKVRYGRDNGEVYAQVAATRLLWALGFAANRMYPVRIVCRGCPDNPFKGRAVVPEKTVTFDPATIDEKADGKTIETKPEQGWSWAELDRVDENAGGAPAAQRDALKLLAAFMQHSSNKAINQRLVCVDPPKCSHSMLIVADVGKTFGRANALNDDDSAAVNFKAWSTTPIWTGASGACTAKLGWSFSGTLHDPVIGEPGRKFLADLLVQLSDRQIQDLFEVARFPMRDPGATVADWVKAFKDKREQIVSRRCGPS